jgi:hypothetical protein
MSVRFTIVIGIVLLAAATGGQQVSAQQPKTEALGVLINRTRVDHGAKPLARSSELDIAAAAHSRDMVEHNYLDHPGSDGSTPQERADRAGYHVPAQSGWIVVEIISAISEDPAGPLDWWVNQSPDIHGKALLDPRWREMGVGYAAGGEYGNYWTVLFGCRPAVLPMVQLDGKLFETTEQCGDPLATTLTVTPREVRAGSDFEVRWTSIGAPHERDWLGLYRPSDPDGAYLSWTYVSCAWLPLTPRPNGWCSMRIPADLPSGTYDVRLHADDGNQRLASSGPISVLSR